MSTPNTVSDQSDNIDTSEGVVEATPVALPVAAPTDRISLRNKILGSNQTKTKVVTFFGANIELHQPTVEEIESRNNGGGRTSVADLLIQYAFVPGTNEKMFDEADKASLSQLPWSADITAVTQAIAVLTGFDVDGAEKN